MYILIFIFRQRTGI